MTGSQIN